MNLAIQRHPAEPARRGACMPLMRYASPENTLGGLRLQHPGVILVHRVPTLHSRSPWILAFCLLAWLLPGLCNAQARLPLTDAERAWIAAHPVVAVGVSTEFPPYYFADERGRYEGFVIDLMDRLAQRAGLRIEYHRYTRFGDTLQALRAQTIDMTPFASESASRRDYLTFVRPLFSTQMVIVADRRLGDVSADADFGGYRVAVEKESTGADLLAEHFPNVHPKVYDSAEQAVMATAAGDADVFLGFRQVAVYFMEKHLTANLVLRGTLDTQGTSLGPAVRKDLPELAGILDKAVSSLTMDEIAEVAGRWLPRAMLSSEPHGQLALTPAQQAWVKDHAGIRLGFDAGFAPIAFKNMAGGFDGLAADITRTLARKIGLIVTFENGGSFADVFEQARHGDLDIVVAAARNAERVRDFDFVGPFLRVPTVVVATVDRDMGAGLDVPGRLRLALLRQHFLIPQLRSRHPNLVLREYDSQAEVLQALRTGQADLAIGNMKVVNQLLEQRHTGALRIVGTVPQGDSELYFAVRKSLPELALILRVALDAMTPAELADLENRWLRVEWTEGVPWQRVLLLGLGAGAIACVVVGSLWLGNRRLRLAQRTLETARHVAEEQVAARAGFTAYLSHELRGTLGGLAGGLELLGSTGQAAGRYAALVEAMRGSTAGLLELCERTLDFERALRGGIDLREAPVGLAAVIERAITPWRMQAELKGISLVLHLDFASDLQVACDGMRLGQVLQNLVGNAVKFTAHGGVGVRAAWDASERDAGWLRVTVDDTGPGIPDAEQATLFQPYAQGESGRQAGRGAGLGLSITAQIIGAMQGTIQLAATSAAGTSFVFRVPMSLVQGERIRAEPLVALGERPTL
jgi:signal transduction histidine kinase